jgi:hypothetical protein
VQPVLNTNDGPRGAYVLLETDSWWKTFDLAALADKVDRLVVQNEALTAAIAEERAMRSKLLAFVLNMTGLAALPGWGVESMTIAEAAAYLVANRRDTKALEALVDAMQHAHPDQILAAKVKAVAVLVKD